MNKFLGLIAGGVCLFVGILLLIAWWYEFMFIFRGVIPTMLILGGAIAFFAGLSELKDTLKTKK